MFLCFIVSEYLSGTHSEQEIESGDMSTFDMALTTRGNFLSHSRSFDVVDHSAFIVPPKSFNPGDHHIFDMNMNSFNDIIFPNRNFQHRSSWDKTVKEASCYPSSISDISRSSSVDVGIKQTEKTENRQTTVEVKVTSHADDVIKRPQAGGSEKKKCVTERGIADDVTNDGNDAIGVVHETETETEVQVGSESDADVKDSAVLNLIETMVEIQQKYNHLKSVRYRKKLSLLLKGIIPTTHLCNIATTVWV
jgi:hypothetical protein